MNELLFNIFPNERFIDLGLYQFGLEQCAPAHSFGPATRNHYLFHYVLSGSGTLYGPMSRHWTQKVELFYAASIASSSTC